MPDDGAKTAVSVAGPATAGAQSEANEWRSFPPRRQRTNADPEAGVGTSVSAEPRAARKVAPSATGVPLAVTEPPPTISRSISSSIEEICHVRKSGPTVGVKAAVPPVPEATVSPAAFVTLQPVAT